MKNFLITACVIVAILIGTLGLIWIAQGNEFFLYRYFAPKREAVKREVFEQSKEYQHGTIQELDKMRLEHVKSNSSTVKTVIENRALRMVAEFDKLNLPEDLRMWIYSIEDK